MKKLILLFSLLFLILPSAIFSQRSTADADVKVTYNITIRCNTKAFTLFVDNQQVNGSRATVSAGSHSILVKSHGYVDWQQNVYINKNQTINVNMTPAISKHRLIISSNVNSAIFINNKMVANDNFSRELDAGTYSIAVRSNGFKDYKATVKLDRDTHLNATLIPNQHQVAINTNVNSSIFINNKMN